MRFDRYSQISSMLAPVTVTCPAKDRTERPGCSDFFNFAPLFGDLEHVDLHLLALLMDLQREAIGQHRLEHLFVTAIQHPGSGWLGAVATISYRVSGKFFGIT